MKKILLIPLVLFSQAALADTPPPGTVKAKLYSGDGATAITATSGALDVHITGSIASTVAQGAAGLDPWLVDVSSSALPTNACQETGGHLASIDAKLSTPMPVTGTFWQATQPVSGTFWQATQPVSGTVGVSSLPALPTGANTIGAVNINGTVPVSGTFWQATQPVSGTLTCDAGSGPFDVTGTVTANAGSGTFLVDGSAHVQPVSGTFWQATQPISAASLPLPSGAATEATLGSVGSNTSSTASSVASIDTKTPALGQALAAGSVPVVLTASQLSTLTPLSTVTANAGSGTFLVDGSAHPQPVTGTFWQATQPVSGTVTANAGTGTFVVNASGFTVPVSGTFWQATQPVSGTVTANIGTSGSLALDASVTGLQVTQGSTTSGQSGGLALGAVTTAAPSYTTAKSNPLSLTTAGALRVDGSASTQPVSGTFWQATQPISGTVTANAGTGTFTVDGSGHTQPVSGTFWQTTQPVSIATLPSLAAGTALIGKVGIDQTTPGTTNGVQVNAALPAGSNVIGHVITDSGSVTAATQSGTWNVNATPVVPTATTVKQAALTIGTSAVRLTTDAAAPSSTRTLLVAQLLSTSTAACYFGSSSVASSGASRGVQMFAGQTFSFTNDAGDYYAICDASSQTFYVTEQE